MQSRLKTQINQPVMQLRVTGKVTRPSVAVTDPAFDARKYQFTDLTPVFDKAKKQLRG